MSRHDLRGSFSCCVSSGKVFIPFYSHPLRPAFSTPQCVRSASGSARFSPSFSALFRYRNYPPGRPRVREHPCVSSPDQNHTAGPWPHGNISALFEYAPNMGSEVNPLIEDGSIEMNKSGALQLSARSLHVRLKRFPLGHYSVTKIQF